MADLVERRKTRRAYDKSLLEDDPIVEEIVREAVNNALEKAAKIADGYWFALSQSAPSNPQENMDE